MKKVFTLILLCTAFTMSLSAATLKVAGSSVNLSSTTSVTITNGVSSGKVVYDPSAKALYLTNADITSSSSCIESDVNGLTLYLSGTCKLTCTSSSAVSGCLYFSGKTYIRPAKNSVPTLRLSHTGSGSALLGSADTDINFYGMHIYGETSTNQCFRSIGRGKLGLNYCWVDLTAPSNGYAIYNFSGGFTTSSSSLASTVVRTSNVSWNNSKGGFVNTNGTLIQKVTMVPALTIGQFPLPTDESTTYKASSDNASVMGLKSGTVTWSLANKALTFDQATINPGGYGALSNNGVEGLTLNFTGNNKNFSGSNSNKVTIYKNTHLRGTSTPYYNNALTIDAGTGRAIHSYGGNLYVHDMNLQLKGGYGISGQKSSTEVYITDALVNISTTTAAISDVKNCELTNVDCAGSAFLSSKYGFCKSDGQLATNVTLAIYPTTYPVTILGHQVNSVNCEDFVVPGMGSGKIVYNNTNKKLS